MYADVVSIQLHSSLHFKPYLRKAVTSPFYHSQTVTLTNSQTAACTQHNNFLLKSSVEQATKHTFSSEKIE